MRIYPQRTPQFNGFARTIDHLFMYFCFLIDAFENNGELSILMCKKKDSMTLNKK